MLIKRYQGLSQASRLKLFSRGLTGVILAVELLVFCSLASTASNLMIINEFTTDTDMDYLQQSYPSTPSLNSAYLLSQRMIVALDVLLLFALPLLVFSVFTFQKKGNLIIMVFSSGLAIARWCAGVMLLTGGSSVRESWSKLWESLDEGSSAKCLV